MMQQSHANSGASWRLSVELQASHHYCDLSLRLREAGLDPGWRGYPDPPISHHRYYIYMQQCTGSNRAIAAILYPRRGIKLHQSHLVRYQIYMLVAQR